MKWLVKRWLWTRRWAESIGHDCIHGHFRARSVATNENDIPRSRVLLIIGGVFALVIYCNCGNYLGDMMRVV